MKRTITVNLNGIVFNIDDDAYSLLDKYLKDIETHFANDEAKDEIIADIESRIAELFSDRMKSTKDTVKEVITVDDVNEIIATMGNPSQFSDNEEPAPEQTSDSSSKNEKKKTSSHRLYRDPENAMLGGVLAGIAAYFNIDKTVLRLIYALLTFFGLFAGFGWFMLIAYFLIWIIAPKAVTMAQRLEMRGEDVTVENIKSGFESAKEFVKSEEFKSNAKSIGNRLGEVFMVIAKIFGAFFGVIFSIAGFAIVAALIVVLVALIANPWFSVDWFGAGFSLENGIMLLVALLLVVGCPVFSIIYWVTRLLNQKRAKSNMPLWISTILWLAGIFMLISIGVNFSVLEFNKNNKNNWTVNFNTEFFDNEDVDYHFVTDTAKFSDFTDLNLSGAISAVLVQDTVSQVIVSAPEYIRNRLNVKTGNNKLSIYHKTGVWNGSRRINVVVHAKDFNNIDVLGASKLTTRDTIKTQNLKLNIAGASKADLKVRAENIDVNAVGASKLTLAGSAVDANFDILGASKINAEDFSVTNLKIDATGASHANVLANESINVAATGASSVSVWGKPTVRKSKSLGASKINYKE